MYILQQYHVLYGRIGHRYTDYEYTKLIPDQDKKYFKWTSEEDENDEPETVFVNEVTDDNWR